MGRRDTGIPAQSNCDLDEIAYWIGYVPTTEELDALYNGGVGVDYESWATPMGRHVAPPRTPDPVLEMTTTSLSATWKANSITKSGGTLTWAVYDSNDDLLTFQVANNPTFDMSGYPGTKTVRVTSPDGWASLTRFYSWSLDLVTLDLSVCEAIPEIQCYNNLLEELIISGCTLVEDIDCSDNALVTLDVSHNPALLHLYCYDNKLTGPALDALIITLNSGGLTWGALDYSVQTPDTSPSSAARTAYNGLTGKNWTLTGNAPPA
jgi:hypothetical protein